MTQPVVYFAFYLLGLAFQLGFGARRHAALACALAFISGAALWVIASLVCLVGPLGFGKTPWIVAYVVPAVVCVAGAALRWRPTRRDLAIVAAWTAAIAVYFYWLATFDATRFSADSRHIVRAGLEMPDVSALIYSSVKGFYLTMIHSIAQFTPEDYFYSFAPAIGAATAPIFVLVGWRGLASLGVHRTSARVLVVVAALACFTAYNYLWHTVYVHNNLPSAVYLFAFAGMFWLAELENDAGYLPSAFLFLFAYTTLRMEALLFGAAILVIACYPSRLPPRLLTLGMGLYVAAFWYLFRWAPEGSERTEKRAKFLDDEVHLAIAVFAGWLVVWQIVSRTRARPLLRFVRTATVLGVVALIAVGYFVRNAELETSATMMWRNMLEQRTPFWGYSWHAVIVLALVSLAVPSVPHGRVLSHGALVTFLLVLAIGLVHPYRYGATDSANRMVIQVLPLAIFYLSMQFIPFLYGTPSGVVQTTEP